MCRMTETSATASTLKLELPERNSVSGCCKRSGSWQAASGMLKKKSARAPERQSARAPERQSARAPERQSARAPERQSARAPERHHESEGDFIPMFLPWILRFAVYQSPFECARPKSRSSDPVFSMQRTQHDESIERCSACSNIVPRHLLRWSLNRSELVSKSGSGARGGWLRRGSACRCRWTYGIRRGCVLPRSPSPTSLSMFVEVLVHQSAGLGEALPGRKGGQPRAQAIVGFGLEALDHEIDEPRCEACSLVEGSVAA
jgi:hypothetical protein